jgi:glycosyltransferase involved in cell wall biosynthesis
MGPLRVLLLTFYYEPDLCAGSFRATAFVAALAQKLPEGSTIDVLTTKPNRYKAYSRRAEDIDVQHAVTIRRFSVPAHASGMTDQVLTFSVFAWKVFREVKAEKYHLVVATSSRMFTAFLGALCARRVKAPLYLDIRDIFNQTISDVVGNRIRPLLPVLNAIERFTFSTAARVNLVSPAFLAYFKARYPKLRFSVFPNGIDDEFLSLGFAENTDPSPKDLKRVVCAGNIGQGQGLHHILPELAHLVKDAGFHFYIVGDGGARDLLQAALVRANVQNVTLVAPVQRTQLIEMYRTADVLFLHLNDLPAFHSVIPSKLFEYAATGKPLLAGVAGYAARFIEQEVPGAAVIPPCNAKAAAEALQTLPLSNVSREDFIRRFRRDRLMEGLAEDCLSVLSSKTVESNLAACFR